MTRISFSLAISFILFLGEINGFKFQHYRTINDEKTDYENNPLGLENDV
jgi:hypothetical protein